MRNAPLIVTIFVSPERVQEDTNQSYILYVCMYVCLYVCMYVCMLKFSKLLSHFSCVDPIFMKLGNNDGWVANIMCTTLQVKRHMFKGHSRSKCLKFASICLKFSRSYAPIAHCIDSL